MLALLMIILTMVILRYYSWWEHYNFPLNNCPPDNCPLDNCSPDNCHLEQLCVGQFPPRTIARRQLPPGSYPPDDCPRHNYPRTIGNWQLSRGGIALEPFMLDLWLSVSNTSYVKKR